MEFVFLISIVAFIYFFFDVRRFNKSDYKRCSGNGYRKTRFNKGNYGEYLTFSYLEHITGYNKILVNVYIPGINQTTTEIDLLFINPTGIYVIESKNYSGWIFGSEKNKYWTQTFQTGRKEKFYNPIWQNNTHIRCLDNLLKEVSKEQLKSIIVFSERCTLKKVDVNSYNISVIKRNNLNAEINRLISNSKEVFSQQMIDKLYGELQQFIMASEIVKRNHIEEINRFKNTNDR